VAQNCYNGIDKYKKDTTVIFKEGVNEYSFVWSNISQGFYWDTISNKIDCYHVKFNILNDTKDTLKIKRIGGGDGALLFHRNYNESKTNVLGKQFILPNEIITIEVTQYGSKYRLCFRKALQIQYSINNEFKNFSINTWGYFIKDYPSKLKKTSNHILQKNEVVKSGNKNSTIELQSKNKNKSSAQKMDKIVQNKSYSEVVRPKVTTSNQTEKLKTVTIHLELLKEYESINDLIFTRWNGEKTEVYNLNGKRSITLKVKDKVSVYGMFYCTQYGVISKFKEQIKFDRNSDKKELNIKVKYLFENRKDYFYGGYLMSEIKQPYKIKGRKGEYKLTWSLRNYSGDKQQKTQEIKAYIKSLGYGTHSFIYEPNLTKAVQLEQRLKNAKYHITMEPLIWHHGTSSEGWGGGYEVYANKFEIRFTNDVSEYWIKAFFKKYQITDYNMGYRTEYVSNTEYIVYTFSFKYTISRSYMRILDKMWMKREVLKLKQFRGGLADKD